MTKIEEAQKILGELGLPKSQQNKISALTLLALAGLKSNDKWSSASNRRVTLSKDIIDFVNRNYEQKYRPNTRESFRKIALKPFVTHGIALLNPDDPNLKPSSANTHYALSELALNTLKKYTTKKWEKAVDDFKNHKSSKNTLEIKNFKSINHIKFRFSRVNVFIGKPNSGKSNLLEALSLFNFLQEKRNNNEPGIIRYNTLDNIFFDRNLNSEIEISLHEHTALLLYKSNANAFLHLINPSLEFLKEHNYNFNKNLSLNDLGKKLPFLSNTGNLDRLSSKFEILGNDGKFTSRGEIMEKENPIRRYEFKDGASYGDLFSDYLKIHGENLFAIVQSNEKLREWINSFYNEYNLEFLIDFSSRTFEIQKKEKGVVYKIPFELTPDTFRRMLFHVAAVYSNKNTTILFEEPESHSFPPYVKELSDLIKSDENNNTYFITTHSPYFFSSMVEDSKKFKDISFFHVYYEDFQTKVKKLTNKELDNLWDSGADVFFNIDSFLK